MPIQGGAAAFVSVLTLTITLTIWFLGTRPEKKRPADRDDEH